MVTLWKVLKFYWKLWTLLILRHFFYYNELFFKKWIIFLEKKNWNVNYLSTPYAHINVERTNKLFIIIVEKVKWYVFLCLYLYNLNDCEQTRVARKNN